MYPPVWTSHLVARYDDIGNKSTLSMVDSAKEGLTKFWEIFTMIPSTPKDSDSKANNVAR